MKIAAVQINPVTIDYQTIKVEDGPVIPAGSQYVGGTEFQVETIKRKRLRGKDWGDVTVIGYRDTHNAVLGVMEHQRVFPASKLPKWLQEILSQAMAEYILEGSAEEQEQEDKNGPFPNPKNWGKVDVEDAIDKQIHEDLANGHV